jgi:hypothetical protein
MAGGTATRRSHRASAHTEKPTPTRVYDTGNKMAISPRLGIEPKTPGVGCARAVPPTHQGIWRPPRARGEKRTKFYCGKWFFFKMCGVDNLWIHVFFMFYRLFYNTFRQVSGTF